MPFRLLIVFSTLGLLLACSERQATEPVTVVSEAPAIESPADIAYVNGKIYTVDEASPWAEAVAVKDGRFIAVGSTEKIMAMAGDAGVVDLGGKFVLPGLVDTHTHPFVSAFQELDQLVLDDPQSPEDIQQQLAAYAEAHPQKEWILGFAWPKGMFPGENPHRNLLDEVVSDRPVCLMDQGGHAYLCNTRALEVAGIMAPDFEMPKFGVVERDEEGVPTGTVRETVLGHIKGFAPRESAELYAQAVDLVQELFLRNGVTAHRTSTGTEDGLKALQAKAEAGEISLHWAVSLDVNYLESTYTLDERMQQIADRGQYASEFVDPNFAKIFLDGDVSGYGIWMLEPFPGTEDNYGTAVIDVDDLNRWTLDFDQQGISVQYHAVGSASIHAIANALETAAQANGGKLKTRHYPDHMGFPSDSDLKRLVRLNTLIGFAPYFGFEFPGVHDSYAEFLGEEKLGELQPARSVLDAGGIIGTGTDWSSLPQDPWPLLEAMVHRRNPWASASESTANNAEQTITIEQAIHAYTLGGAHALLREDRIGSIEVGKYADFVVLDRNLLDIPVDDIDQTEVLGTVFSGKVVYDAAGALR